MALRDSVDWLEPGTRRTVIDSDRQRMNDIYIYICVSYVNGFAQVYKTRHSTRFGEAKGTRSHMELSRGTGQGLKKCPARRDET